jgi:hypothetical protein
VRAPGHIFCPLEQVPPWQLLLLLGGRRGGKYKYKYKYDLVYTPIQVAGDWREAREQRETRERREPRENKKSKSVFKQIHSTEK